MRPMWRQRYGGRHLSHLGELDLELMALAGDGWASDELTGIAKQAALRYCPQVDEWSVGELAARLCARAAQWWNDNDTWEDEA